jgi:hypothetical protein
MPAYFELAFSFRYSDLHVNFVKQVYDTIFQNGFLYKDSYLDPGISLDEIIAWNQNKLEKKFKLGLKQTLRQGYHQILLQREGYTELRLFWMYSNEEISLFLITPESDILDANFKFISSKFTPFIELAKVMWDKTDVITIQTALEIDGGVTDLKGIVSSKELPFVRPFAILGKKYYQEMPNIEVHDIFDDGILLFDKTLIN